ncbi:DUF4389 domain-containing protein [Teredinibacter purpureus]|uniref:DUF4389 domain-containing protein n=1 Tax=Teredinibacter purpureus TaxID=2731756 RepID=UPI0009E63755|nr:DUF4389 domain-containing protein [Teredinibacter purpureus]
MDEQLKSNLTSSKHWFRLIYMVLFAVFLQLALSVMWILVVIQFLFALITGNDNKKLRTFGGSLIDYIADTIAFLTYNSEDKPFPFSDWPEYTGVDVAVDETVSTVTPADEVEPTDTGSVQDTNKAE